MRTLIDRHLTPTPDDARPKLIDLGCGTGALLRDCAHAFDVAGMDTHEAAIQMCARDGLDVRFGTLPDAVPFEPASADVVVLSDVLEHVEQDHASAKAAAALLRPGGLMVCTVPAHPWMWTARDALHHHKRRYTRAAYGLLFEDAGLEPVLLSWYNTALFPLMAAVRLAKRALPAGRAKPDVTPLPSLINAPLRELFAAEARWLTRAPLPFGASLISMHRRVK